MFKGRKRIFAEEPVSPEWRFRIARNTHPRPKQDVVPIDIVPDHIPQQHTASQMQNSYLDNPHTIEVAMKDITVRISNDADPVLLTRTFRLLQEFSC